MKPGFFCAAGRVFTASDVDVFLLAAWGLIAFLHEPSADPAGQLVAAFHEKETPDFAFDDYGVAVSLHSFPVGGSRAEIPDLVNYKSSAVSPGDCPRLHITGGVNLGEDIQVNLFRHGDLLSETNHNNFVPNTV